MTKEYWRWKEYNWKSPDIDWTKGKVITAGIDVGSVSTQAVILVDGQLYAMLLLLKLRLELLLKTAQLLLLKDLKMQLG